jgi:hypothetical protein
MEDVKKPIYMHNFVEKKNYNKKITMHILELYRIMLHYYDSKCGAVLHKVYFCQCEILGKAQQGQG